MTIQTLRSDATYRKVIEAPESKRIDIYRYELMEPFAGKWACYNVPTKAPKAGDYDVMMAARMLGYLVPPEIGENTYGQIQFRVAEGTVHCVNSNEVLMR